MTWPARLRSRPRALRILAAVTLVAGHALAQSAPSREPACDRAGTISAKGIGPLRIGMTIDSLARTCGVVERRYSSANTTREYAIRVGTDTLTVYETNGRVDLIQTTSAIHRTRDSLGVGSTLARLLMLPDIDGGPGDGTDRYEVHATSGEHCGIIFWLDAATAEILGRTKGNVARALGMRGGNGVVVEVSVRGACPP